MARDFIKIDRSNAANAVKVQALLNYIAVLRTAYDAGKYVRDIMVHNNATGVFTDLEALFGIPTGQGQAVFDLVNGSVGAMEGTFQNSNAKDLTERVG